MPVAFILTLSQRECTLNHRSNLLKRLLEFNEDIYPVELIDGTFCIPIETAQSFGLRILKTRLEDAGHDLSTITRRNVTASEVLSNQNIT